MAHPRAILAAALVAASVVTAAAFGARTAQARPEVTYGGERYQRDLVTTALERHQLRADPAPEGKIIERIVVVPLDVFLPGEPYPQFANWFHVTTVPQVVRRELLFTEGDAWTPQKVKETGRNLRSYLFIATAQIAAARGSAPDRVVAVIVTKDLWSLRPNADFSFVGSRFETLDAQLTEQNLFGRMKQATADLGFNLATLYAGAQYRDPRLLGSQLLMQERGDLIWNRGSGRLEGGVASVSLDQPLYTLDTPWAWGASFSYRRDVYRFFSGGQVEPLLVRSTGETLPYAINRRLLDFRAGVKRSLGRERKRNFSAGYRAFVHEYNLPAAPGPRQQATVDAVNAAIVPRTESAGMLYAGFEAYWAEFRELLDIETYGLTEDTRIGPQASVELRYANGALGFSSSFLQPVASASWTSWERDNLFRLSASGEVRRQTEIVGAGDWVNGEATLRVREVTPKLGFVRLHGALQGTRRHNNVNRDFSALGGNNSLRGYPSSYLRGTNLWLANFEARTAPLALMTLHFGLAGFMDVGSAADRLEDLGAHASVGAGLRVGLPQFNREVLRFDLGFPLEQVVGAEPAYLVVQYGQAF